MIKKIIVLLLFILAAGVFLPKAFFGEAGHASEIVSGAVTLPPLKGTTLAGGAVDLPTGLGGKPAVVGFAFSAKAEQDLKGWMQPIYDQFIAKQEGVFSAGAFDGQMYFVACLGGAAAAAGKQLETQAKAKTDAELKSHVIIYKESAEPFIKALGISDKTKPVFAVLAPTGEIKAIVAGSYTEEKMDELLEKID